MAVATAATEEEAGATEVAEVVTEAVTEAAGVVCTVLEVEEEEEEAEEVTTVEEEVEAVAMEAAGRFWVILVFLSCLEGF